MTTTTTIRRPRWAKSPFAAGRWTRPHVIRPLGGFLIYQRSEVQYVLFRTSGTGGAERIVGTYERLDHAKHAPSDAPSAKASPAKCTNPGSQHEAGNGHRP